MDIFKISYNINIHVMLDDKKLSEHYKNINITFEVYRYYSNL